MHVENRLLFWKALTSQNLHRIMQATEESGGRVGVAVLSHLKESPLLFRLRCSDPAVATFWFTCDQHSAKSFGS